MKRCEMGYCIWILREKLWGKVVFEGRLRSENWWRRRLENEMNQPAIVIPPENLWECCPAEPAPMPFEQEMGWTDDTAEHWLKWLQKAYRRLTFL